MKKYLIFVGVLLVLFSCKNNEGKFEKHESGLEYRIVSSVEGATQKAKIDDVMILNFSYETEDGKVLYNSSIADRKYLRKLIPPTHTGGSFEDGLAMLTVGDSAIFRINADSFLRNSESYSNLPKDVKPEDIIIIKVKLIEILETENFDSHLSEKYHEDIDTEMKILEKFLKNANVTVEPTESGLYYIEHEAGDGKQAFSGANVSVHYTVKLIDGLVIETSLDKKPISFTLGQGQVIDAWDEGITYMREGGKAMLICPSDIAYGELGKGDIPPFSTLVFELELISVK